MVNWLQWCMSVSTCVHCMCIFTNLHYYRYHTYTRKHLASVTPLNFWPHNPYQHASQRQEWTPLLHPDRSHRCPSLRDTTSGIKPYNLGEERRDKVFTFNADMVAEFNWKYRVDMLCRAQEMKKWLQ
jgi:hypothetical protein